MVTIGNNIKYNRRLKSYILGAIAAGYTSDEIRDSLIAQGWNEDVIDFHMEDEEQEVDNSKFLPLIGVAVVFLFAIIISFNFYSITGAITAGGLEWENKLDITANDTVSEVNVHVIFGESKPTDCQNGLYLVDEEINTVSFDLQNEVYENDVCTETDVTFSNSIFNSEGNGTEEVTYTLYYGLVVPEENNTEENETDENETIEPTQEITFIDPTPVSGAELNSSEFTVSITLNNSATQAVFELNGTNSTMTGSDMSWTITKQNLTNGEYTYKVHALTQDVWFSSSPRTVKLNLTIPNTLPEKPSLVSPLENATVTDTTPTLKWNNSVDANNDKLHYKVQIADDANFTANLKTFESSKSSDKSMFSGNPPYTSGSGEVDFTFASALTNNKLYFWRVAAKDAEGYGNFSDARNFTLNSTATSYSVDIVAKDVKVGELSTITVNVSNKGDTNITLVGDVKIYSSSNLVLSTQAVTATLVTVGTTKTITKSWSTYTPGTYTAKLNVTASNITKTDQDQLIVSALTQNTSMPSGFNEGTGTNTTSTTTKVYQPVQRYNTTNTAYPSNVSTNNNLAQPRTMTVQQPTNETASEKIDLSKLSFSQILIIGLLIGAGGALVCFKFFQQFSGNKKKQVRIPRPHSRR